MLLYQKGLMVKWLGRSHAQGWGQNADNAGIEPRTVRLESNASQLLLHYPRLLRSTIRSRKSHISFPIFARHIHSWVSTFRHPLLRCWRSCMLNYITQSQMKMGGEENAAWTAKATQTRFIVHATYNGSGCKHKCNEHVMNINVLREWWWLVVG